MRADREQRDSFVVADPHVVYYDAVMHSPWSHDGGGHLPERGDWSTYRYTVKDIILGIATHRYDKNSRRLEIRAYFVGEHPIFQELEASRAMLIVLCCQAYQSGGSMELYFEQGLPLDVRELIERRLGLVLSGHKQTLPPEVTQRLFAELSDFPAETRQRIVEEGVSSDTVCFNVYRGTWTPLHIALVLERGIPLRWLFQQAPAPLVAPAAYAHLMQHLRAVLLEGYAIGRLENRALGETMNTRISRTMIDGQFRYRPDEPLHLADADSLVQLPAGQPFRLLPLLPRTAAALADDLGRLLGRGDSAADGPIIPVLPLDVLWMGQDMPRLLERCRAGDGLLIVELTLNQLLTEAQLKLAVTSSEADTDVVDAINVDRYPD